MAPDLSPSEIAAGYSVSEPSALFHDNAAKFYRL